MKLLLGIPSKQRPHRRLCWLAGSSSRAHFDPVCPYSVSPEPVRALALELPTPSRARSSFILTASRYSAFCCPLSNNCCDGLQRTCSPSRRQHLSASAAWICSKFALSPVPTPSSPSGLIPSSVTTVQRILGDLYRAGPTPSLRLLRRLTVPRCTRAILNPDRVRAYALRMGS